MQERANELSRLYAEVGPRIWSYAARHCRRAYEADEVLQETFLAAAKNWNGLLAAHSKQAWLIGIARNLIRHRIRQWASSKYVELCHEPTAPSSPKEDPRLEPMRAAIAKLPQAQREALELRLVSELSYAEIAEALGIPIGTVRSRLHEALRRLRETIGAEVGVLP